MMLNVKVIKAILTHNTQIGSNMDPFVLIRLGEKQYKGRTLKLAGDMPQFNQQYTFQIRDNLSKLHVMVYDEDMAVNDLVGEMEIDLEEIIIKPSTQAKWYSLKYVNKPAGKVLLQFQCGGNGHHKNMQSQKQQQAKQTPSYKTIQPNSLLNYNVHVIQPNHRYQAITHQLYPQKKKKCFSFRTFTKLQASKKKGEVINNGYNNINYGDWSAIGPSIIGIYNVQQLKQQQQKQQGQTKGSLQRVNASQNANFYPQRVNASQNANLNTQRVNANLNININNSRGIVPVPYNRTTLMSAQMRFQEPCQILSNQRAQENNKQYYRYGLNNTTNKAMTQRPRIPLNGLYQNELEESQNSHKDPRPNSQYLRKNNRPILNNGVLNRNNMADRLFNMPPASTGLNYNNENQNTNQNNYLRRTADGVGISHNTIDSNRFISKLNRVDNCLNDSNKGLNSQSNRSNINNQQIFINPTTFDNTQIAQKNNNSTYIYTNTTKIKPLDPSYPTSNQNQGLRRSHQ